MPPSASDPESGSVMAHDPILPSDTRPGSQRFFCARVPRLRMVLDVSPIDTPSEVTRPRLTDDSSQLSMMNADWLIPPDAADAPPRERDPAPVSPAARASSAASSLASASSAIWSTPKVDSSLRRMSYGARRPDSSSSEWGRISLSMNARNASRTIRSSGDHSYTDHSLHTETRTRFIVPGLSSAQVTRGRHETRQVPGRGPIRPWVECGCLSA